MRDPQLIVGKDHLVGVEAAGTADGTWLFHWVHLRRRKRAVHILRQGAGVEGPEALAQAIGTRCPVALVVRSERFLLRHLAGGFDRERDLSKLFPNADAGSLAVDVLIHNGRSHVAIARNEVLDPLLGALAACGLRTTQVFLGPMVLLAMEELLSAVAAERPVGGHVFEREAGEVIAYRLQRCDAPRTVAMGDEGLDERCALAMAAAWQWWFTVLEQNADTPGPVIRARREERYRLIYEGGQVILLVTLLALVAFDAGLRQRLGQDREALEASIAAQDVQQGALEALQRAVDDRRRSLAVSGTGCDGDRIRVIDRIAASVPPSITLNEFWLAPLGGPLRKDKEFLPRAGALTINGSLQDPGSLTKWLSEMKAMAGVRNAHLVHLEEGNGEGPPTFSITVELS